jgi:ubiquinol-cytochrome c reductase cytochrome c1 subunit
MTIREPVCRPSAVALLTLATVFTAVLAAAPVRAQEAAEEPTSERQHWPFAGFRGQYDRQQLQRGFQIYQNVCSACHGLKRVRFRSLAEPGGPEFPEAAVKALATSWPYQISGELDDQGHPVDRLPGLADEIIGPYKNDTQARAAQNGALPPDLSLITKARMLEIESSWWRQWLRMAADVAKGYQESGADYVYGLLTGYRDAPPGMEVPEGMHYNITFPGHRLAMPPPLAKDNVVEYQADAGAKGSLEQNARDIAAFLNWASDPTLDTRKQLGWLVLLYLGITTVLLYLVKRRIWSRIPH